MANSLVEKAALWKKTFQQDKAQEAEEALQAYRMKALEEQIKARIALDTYRNNALAEQKRRNLVLEGQTDQAQKNAMMTASENRALTRSQMNANEIYRQQALRQNADLQADRNAINYNQMSNIGDYYDDLTTQNYLNYLENQKKNNLAMKIYEQSQLDPSLIPNYAVPDMTEPGHWGRNIGGGIGVIGGGLIGGVPGATAGGGLLYGAGAVLDNIFSGSSASDIDKGLTLVEAYLDDAKKKLPLYANKPINAALYQQQLMQIADKLENLDETDRVKKIRNNIEALMAIHVARSRLSGK